MDGLKSNKVIIPDMAVTFIKKWEGFSAKSYPGLENNGTKTIGYGHVIQEGEIFNEPMDKDYAEYLLCHDLQPRAKAIEDSVKVYIMPFQFSALLSLVYNIGEHAFKQSTLLKKLNDKKYHEAAEQFGRWVYVGKVKTQGLVNRREAEKRLFLWGKM